MMDISEEWYQRGTGSASYPVTCLACVTCKNLLVFSARSVRSPNPIAKHFYTVFCNESQDVLQGHMVLDHLWKAGEYEAMDMRRATVVQFLQQIRTFLPSPICGNRSKSKEAMRIA